MSVKKDIYVDQLIIEVGRKCNLRCEHCLRGNAENKTVDVERVKDFLWELSSIGSITFTGGEPCLYVDEICEIIDFIMANKIEVYGFYIASNGTKRSLILMSKLLLFRMYCLDCGADDEMCRFEISNDIYHSNYEKNLEWYKGFSFFGVRNAKNGTDTSEYLVAEGRAKDFGNRILDIKKAFYIEDSSDTTLNVEMIYFNAEGYLLPDCDYSYKTQREMKPYMYGSVPLAEIIETYHREVMQENTVA